MYVVVLRSSSSSLANCDELDVFVSDMLPVSLANCDDLELDEVKLVPEATQAKLLLATRGSGVRPAGQPSVYTAIVR